MLLADFFFFFLLFHGKFNNFNNTGVCMLDSV